LLVRAPSSQVHSLAKSCQTSHLKHLGMACAWNLPVEGKNTDRTTHYIPHGATFHIGSVSDCFSSSKAFQLLHLYDLIIMDPPWENLAVKRQRSYVTSASPLSSVTVESLSRDGLIAVWITNRSGIERELESCFRRWNVKRLAAFYWLKVSCFELTVLQSRRSISVGFVTVPPDSDHQYIQSLLLIEGRHLAKPMEQTREGY
uniref:MT-A70-domain-containing protein n=1 Tax=Heligmosomoides polygyrus TaxID=6339 RepID=A0A183GM03_HELPZ